MNLVLICTDQQRRDCVGCYGNRAVETPRLDGLAASGLRFDRAYVTNPICMPNRMSLFTGCYPRNHGMWTNGLCGTPQLPSLSQTLSDAGYATGSVGKLHFMPYGGGDRGWESAARWQSPSPPVDWTGPYGGFHHVELSIGHTQPIAHYGAWFKARGGTEAMLVRGADETRPIPEELHDSIWVGERSAAFIRDADRNKRFFLFASFPDPHHPFDPPASLAAKYQERSVPEPIGSDADLAGRPAHYREHFRGGWHRTGSVPEEHPDGPSKETVRTRRANTYAMIDLIDRGVGMILDAIESTGHADDTLVVFTSDHGELLGDHGLWYKGPFFYEGLVGVPLIVRGPGVAAGSSTGLVSTLDLMPTLLEMLGQQVPASVDGRSFANHLRDPRVATRQSCLIEYRSGYGAADRAAMALVTDRYKYVQHQSGERELTDLVNDPNELCNIADDPAHAATRARLESELLATLIATGARWPEQISHA
jgi:arylsulfatase